MTRTIKVCRKWQGKKPVPSINLQGVYLQEQGFNFGEHLKVEFHKDEIRIKKLDANDILKVMVEQNPSLEKLIKEFGLIACE